MPIEGFDVASYTCLLYTSPWEIFAYLPFGNWNECPDTPELMAVAKY